MEYGSYTLYSRRVTKLTSSVNLLTNRILFVLFENALFKTDLILNFNNKNVLLIFFILLVIIYDQRPHKMILSLTKV